MEKHFQFFLSIVKQETADGQIAKHIPESRKHKK